MLTGRSGERRRIVGEQVEVTERQPERRGLFLAARLEEAAQPQDAARDGQTDHVELGPDRSDVVDDLVMVSVPGVVSTRESYQEAS